MFFKIFIIFIDFAESRGKFHLQHVFKLNNVFSKTLLLYLQNFSNLSLCVKGCTVLNRFSWFFCDTLDKFKSVKPSKVVKFVENVSFLYATLSLADIPYGPILLLFLWFLQLPLPVHLLWLPLPSHHAVLVLSVHHVLVPYLPVHPFFLPSPSPEHPTHLLHLEHHLLDPAHLPN